MTPRLFIDMDGVLADFDRGFIERFQIDHRAKDFPKKEMWDKVYSVDKFFLHLPVMRDAELLMESVHHLRVGGYVSSVYILTACPSSAYEDVAAQKKAWIKEHIGGDYTVLPAYRSESKPAFIQNPGDILIDDWRLNCEAWEAAGGRAVKFEDGMQTRFDLLKMVMKGEDENEV